MTIKHELTSGWQESLAAWGRLAGFVSLVILCVPVFLFLRLAAPSVAQRMPRFFHQALCRLVGMRVRMRGALWDFTVDQTVPTLFVSNHSSYLDIPALGSVIQACFVAKSEVASWPFIGMMAKLQNTIFIERRKNRAATHRDTLRETLEAGKNLIVFPEGTSSDGMRTLPFKSTLFSVVEKPLANGSYVKVQPVTILCTEIGRMPIGRAWRPYYAWYGDMTLVKHVWDVFKIGDFTIDILFHNPVTIEDFGNRKMLASYCEHAVAEGVNQCVTGRFEKPLAQAV